MSGTVFPPCWFFGLRRPSTGAYRILGGARSWWENGSLLEGSHQWAISRDAAASVPVPIVSHSCPCLHRRPSSTRQVGLAQSLMRSLLLSPGSWCTQDTVWALQEWSFCFPQSCEIHVFIPYWPSKPDSLGAPPPIARPLGWGAKCGAQNFHPCGRTSVV